MGSCFGPGFCLLFLVWLVWSRVFGLVLFRVPSHSVAPKLISVEVKLRTTPTKFLTTVIINNISVTVSAYNRVHFTLIEQMFCAPQTLEGSSLNAEMIALSKNKGRGTALVQGPQQNPHSPVDLKHQWLYAAVSTVMKLMNSMCTVNSNIY